MDQNNQTNISDTPTVTPSNVSLHKEKKVGPIVATLIIVFILIIVALYLFATQINQQTPEVDSSLAAQVTIPASTTVEEINSLENDLNSATSGLDGQNF